MRGWKLRCDGSGGDCSATAPFRRASRRSPSRPQCPVKTGSTDEDKRSMCELAENRQHLLGTEQHASSSPASSVTIVRQLELCGASRAQVEGLARPRRALPPARVSSPSLIAVSGSIPARKAKVDPSGSLALQDQMPRAASQT